jgi:uncharacterized RmlC-like cupin family protein
MTETPCGLARRRRAAGRSQKIWAGTVRIDPDAKAGAHHHGRWRA